MWTAERAELGGGERVVFLAAGKSLSFAETIAGWRFGAEFRAFTIATLAATPSPAFFWEMPPIRQGRTVTYEYVTIDSAALERLKPALSAFGPKLEEAGASGVATFRNLGGDALLVAPRPIAQIECYGHIAAFVRKAPAVQQHELLQTLGSAIAGALQADDGRLWVSTSGLGVPWLHIRLDTVPKYYQHRPYAQRTVR